MYERFLWLIYCGIALLLFRGLEKFLERTHLIKTPIEHRTSTGFFADGINKEIFNKASRDLSGLHKHLESWTTEANNSYIYSIGFSKEPGQAGIVNIIYPYSGSPGKWNFQIIQEVSLFQDRQDWPKGESFEEYLSKNPEYVIPAMFKKDPKNWTIIEGKEWFLFPPRKKNKSINKKMKNKVIVLAAILILIVIGIWQYHYNKTVKDCEYRCFYFPSVGYEKGNFWIFVRSGEERLFPDKKQCIDYCIKFNKK
jgi:hypothetical protein